VVVPAFCSYSLPAVHSFHFWQDCVSPVLPPLHRAPVMKWPGAQLYELFPSLLPHGEHVCVSVVPLPLHAEPVILCPAAQRYDVPP
jgi:hypothetical protein